MVDNLAMLCLQCSGRNSGIQGSADTETDITFTDIVKLDDSSGSEEVMSFTSDGIPTETHQPNHSPSMPEWQRQHPARLLGFRSTKKAQGRAGTCALSYWSIVPANSEVSIKGIYRWYEPCTGGRPCPPRVRGGDLGMVRPNAGQC